jgi:hypothetical protein
MWECQHCGEKGNENSFKFCLACGSPRLNLPEAPAAEEDVRNAFSLFTESSPKQNGVNLDDEPAPPEGRWHLPKSLSAIGHKIKGVFPINSGELNHVKLSPDAQDRLETLIQAGVFESKAEAAAYLIEQGIKAEARLFDVVEQKLAEIERLSAELRLLVKNSHE